MEEKHRKGPITMSPFQHIHQNVLANIIYLALFSDERSFFGFAELMNAVNSCYFLDQTTFPNIFIGSKITIAFSDSFFAVFVLGFARYSCKILIGSNLCEHLIDRPMRSTCLPVDLSIFLG